MIIWVLIIRKKFEIILLVFLNMALKTCIFYPQYFEGTFFIALNIIGEDKQKNERKMSDFLIY